MKTPVRTRLLSALLSLVMLVSLLPVSVFAAEPASGTWEKVTEAQEDWSGQYLIVYEKGSLIMDGSLSALDKEGNKVDVTITDGKIVGDYAKYAFTIAPMTGGWSVQSASGKYISGKSGKNNQFGNRVSQHMAAYHPIIIVQYQLTKPVHQFILGYKTTGIGHR